MKEKKTPDIIPYLQCNLEPHMPHNPCACSRDFLTIIKSEARSRATSMFALGSRTEPFVPCTGSPNIRRAFSGTVSACRSYTQLLLVTSRTNA